MDFPCINLIHAIVICIIIGILTSLIPFISSDFASKINKATGALVFGYWLTGLFLCSWAPGDNKPMFSLPKPSSSDK